MTKRFAGLDWASRIHAVCVIDARGGVVAQFEVNHDAAGLAELCRRLRALHVNAVAIERPSGLLVDALLQAGLGVVPIHPNVVKATRPRYRSHGGKSDACDAYLLADLLRTDGHRFEPLAPESDEIRALRALVRGRDDLVATRVQLANQLRALLESFWPGAAEVFADVDSPIALAFIQLYPTPEAASRLGPKRMAAFCAQHAYCGRRSAEELLQRLHQAAAITLGELEMEAKGELALNLARVLARLVEQIKLLTSRIEHAVQSCEDGRILMSFPRAGRICAA
jgi:transposase